MVCSAFRGLPVSSAKAFCPGHITGFLGKVSKIDNIASNYLFVGSLGAGVAIDHGIVTTVKVFNDIDNNINQRTIDYQISINGLIYDTGDFDDDNNNVDVSKSVVQEYIRLTQVHPYYIEIEHKANIPIGYGLASSGAAALSLSYALNNALKVGLDREQAAQIAHFSEIKCKTGLGSVIGQYVGGFELRSAIGAPGIGIVDKIATTISNYKVVILCLSPIFTKSYLDECIDLINGTGEKMLQRLKLSKDINDFLDMSYEFSCNLGLIQGKTEAPIRKLKSLGFSCSVALFGETVFTIVPYYHVNEVVNSLRHFDGMLLVCDIDNEGARII